MSQAEHTRLPVVTHVSLWAAKTEAATLGCQVGLGYSYAAGVKASLADLCPQNTEPIPCSRQGHQPCSVLHLSPDLRSLPHPGPHGGSDSPGETVHDTKLQLEDRGSHHMLIPHPWVTHGISVGLSLPIKGRWA